MKKIAAAMLCSIMLLPAGCNSAGAKPSIYAVRKPLESFLTEKKQRNCKGSVHVDELTVAGVGEYDKDWGGFPVYAAFKVRCQEGRNSSTWTSDGSKKAMAALVRKSALGGYQAFTPEIFAQAEQQMQQQMEQAFKNAFK